MRTEFKPVSSLQPSVRYQPESLSDKHRIGCPIWTGLPVRIEPDSLSDMNRIRCPTKAGIRMYNPLTMATVRIMAVVVVCAAFVTEVKSASNWPQASSLYLSQSSLWEKTVTTRVSSGVANVVSTYSYGSRSGNSAPSYGTTRHYNNGIVTYSSIWTQCYDKYSATPAFRAPYLPGWTITSNVRYSASFAMDYRIPAAWNGHLEFVLDLNSQPVDGRGEDSGAVRRKYSEYDRGAGRSGRFFISPDSQSRTVDKSSTVYYYLHP